MRSGTERSPRLGLMIPLAALMALATVMVSLHFRDIVAQAFAAGRYRTLAEIAILHGIFLEFLAACRT
jgi:hypothetical protein